MQLTPWRNGSASDSRSEGCVFKSRRGQYFFASENIKFCDTFHAEVFFSKVQQHIKAVAVHVCVYKKYDQHILSTNG